MRAERGAMQADRQRDACYAMHASPRAAGVEPTSNPRRANALLDAPAGRPALQCGNNNGVHGGVHGMVWSSRTASSGTTFITLRQARRAVKTVSRCFCALMQGCGFVRRRPRRNVLACTRPGAEVPHPLRHGPAWVNSAAGRASRAPSWQQCLAVPRCRAVPRPAAGGPYPRTCAACAARSGKAADFTGPAASYSPLQDSTASQLHCSES